MKLKNILSVVCFLFVATACSMEDSILDDDSSKLVPEDGSAYVSAVINLEGTQTKATTGNSSDPQEYVADAIASCALFLLDSEGKVVGVHTETYNSTATTQEIRYLTKVNVATKAVAVVNYNPGNSESLLACSDYDDLKNYVEHDAHYRLKIGEGAIDWTEVVGSSSTTENLSTATTAITVKSRTAIVELAEFAVRYKTDKRPVVKLESVSLSNLKTQGGWLEDLKSGVTTGRFDFDKTTYSLPRTPGFYNGDDGHYPLRADVYPNTDGGGRAEFVTLTLTFSVTEGNDSKIYNRSYIINRPSEEDGSFTNNSGHVYVEAGYWYQLKATVNVTSDLVDCDIVCYTNDWIFDDSTFNDVPMSPVN